MNSGISFAHREMLHQVVDDDAQKPQLAISLLPYDWRGVELNEIDTGNNRLQRQDCGISAAELLFQSLLLQFSQCGQHQFNFALAEHFPSEDDVVVRATQVARNRTCAIIEALGGQLKLFSCITLKAKFNIPSLIATSINYALLNFLIIHTADYRTPDSLDKIL